MDGRRDGLELRILVVDDEPLMRQGFRHMLDWRRYEVAAFDEAENAWAAVEKAAVFHPDIVVTDIRMPEMDGLELIGRLKALLPDARFIIVSGYSDFEYAKRAITLGVEHYLVKPVSFRELMQVMESCVSRIRQDRLQREQSMSACLRRLLDKDGRDGAEECLRRLREHGIELESGRYQTAVLRLIGGSGEMNRLARLLEAELDLAGDRLRWVAAPSQGTLRLLAGWDHRQEDALFHSILRGAIDTLNRDGCKAVCGMGPVIGSPEEIGSGAALAARIAQFKGMIGEAGVFAGEELRMPDAAGPLMSQDDLRLLTDALVTNSRQGVARALSRLRDAVRAGSLWPDAFYAAVLEGMVAAQRLLLESGAQLGEDDRRVLSQEHLRGFDSTDSLFSWLEAFFHGVAGRIQHQHSSGGNQTYIISRIKDYVLEHLSEPLNLEAAAKRYHYNPSYLSRLFKKEQGVSFTEYVQELRIARAKRLLLTSRVNVAEVCRRVGYRDYRFFLSVFKEAVGMTPHEYRERGGSGDV